MIELIPLRMVIISINFSTCTKYLLSYCIQLLLLLLLLSCNKSLFKQVKDLTPIHLAAASAQDSFQSVGHSVILFLWTNVR